jgi:hypothetical protein
MEWDDDDKEFQRVKSFRRFLRVRMEIALNVGVDLILIFLYFISH